MKLLFFIGSLVGGGAERVLAIVSNELAERGHDVYIATNNNIPFAYELHKNINVINLFDNYKTDSNIIKRNLQLRKNIRSITKDIRPDVLIPFMFSISSQVILSTLDMKIPVISSEHTTFDKNHTNSEYFKRFYINKLANRTTILTKYDYDFIGNRLKNKTILHNPLTYDILKSEAKRRENVVFAAGSIERWKIKGFDNLIKIWSKISHKFPNWKLQIAGAGKESDFNFLKELVYNYKVGNSVEFLGFQKNLKKVLENKSIFILTSRFEGFGMVLLEAMSQGCAVISFDCIAGPREIISHNKSGLLVEDQNMQEMERSLIQLMSDENLRRKLSEGGLKEAERFSRDKIVDKWEKLFEEVTKK